MFRKFWSLVIFVFLVQLVLISESHATWNKVYQFNNVGRVSAAHFFDRYTGLIGFNGYSGTSILRTTNGGVTWQPVAAPSASADGFWLTDFFFRTSLEGWATHIWDLSTKGVWHTTDGGLSWNEALDAPGAVSVRQTSSALIVTQYANPNPFWQQGISISTDGGHSFSNELADGHNGIDFTDDTHGAVSGFNSGFYFTSNGGVTWAPALTTIQNEAWGVAGIKGSSTFVAVPEGQPSVGSSRVLRSIDNGVNWSQLGTLPSFSSGDIESSGTVLYAQCQGVNDGLVRSADAGASWISIGGPNQAADARFAVTECGNVIFAFDNSGGVYESVDGGDGSMQFSCAHAPDSLRKLTAALCDSARNVYFIHNPFADSTVVLSLKIIDTIGSSLAHTALTLDTSFNLGSPLGPKDSVGFVVGWKPLLSFDTATVDSAILQVVYHDIALNSNDTVDLVLRLEARNAASAFAMNVSDVRIDSGISCTTQDTVVAIINKGCLPFWIIQAQLGRNTDWKLTDNNGAPLTLPLQVPSGGMDSFYLHFTTHIPKTSYDTLRLKIRELGHDSSALIVLRGIGTLSAPLFAGLGAHFDSVSTCINFDTLIQFDNLGCDTITITAADLKSSDWTVLDTNGSAISFPIHISPGDKRLLMLDFHPSAIGAHLARITFHYHYLGFDTTRDYLLDGAGKGSGALAYSRSLDFGRVSICESSGIDTLLDFYNSSCDSILLDSVLIGSDFEFPDSFRLPIWVGSGKTVRLRITFVPKSKGPTNSKAYLKYFVNNTVVYDSIDLHAETTSGTSIYTSSLLTDSILFATRSQCDSKDETKFWIRNSGCDSMAVESAILEGNLSPAITLDLGATYPITLGPNDSTELSVMLDSLLPGVYSGMVHLLLRDADGTTRDTTISIQTEILSGSRTLGIASSVVDLGLLPRCTTFDTTIVYQNTGCLPLTISDRSLTGNGFDLLKSGVDPIILQPGQWDTIRITTTDTHGPISGHLVIQSNDESSRLKTIDFIGIVPSIDSVYFLLSLSKDPVISGDIVTLNVTPDRAVAAHGLTSISGEIVYHTDAFDLLKLTGDPSNQLQQMPISQSNRETHVAFRLTNSNEIALGPQQPILALRLRSTVADTNNVSFRLEGLKLNDKDPMFGTCILSSDATTVDSHYDESCGESYLIQSLRGERLVIIDRITPDPVTNASNYRASFNYHANVMCDLSIVLFDALGRAVMTHTLRAAAGEQGQYWFDLSTLPSGNYYFSVSVANAAASFRGRIQVLR